MFRQFGKPSLTHTLTDPYHAGLASERVTLTLTLTFALTLALTLTLTLTQDDELIQEYMAMNQDEREEAGLGRHNGRDDVGGSNHQTDAAQLLQLGGALLQLVACDLSTLGDQVCARARARSEVWVRVKVGVT